MLSFEDAVRLVAERGEAMQIAADEQDGTMAVYWDRRRSCRVMPGRRRRLGLTTTLLDRPLSLDSIAVQEAGNKAAELAPSVPWGHVGSIPHPFMAPARDRLRKALAEIEVRNPAIPQWPRRRRR